MPIWVELRKATECSVRLVNLIRLDHIDRDNDDVFNDIMQINVDADYEEWSETILVLQYILFISKNSLASWNLNLK